MDFSKTNKNNIGKVSIGGQDSLYLYSILKDINKFKVLLVFLNKGFSWHRELRSFGIFSMKIEETLNEFHNLGLIELKELYELSNEQFETFVSIKSDMEHYFKIYFTTPKIWDLVDKHREDFNFIINENPQMLNFILDVKDKLKPFMLKMLQIEREETTQFIRKVNLNGVTFEKDTKKAREIKKVFHNLGFSKNTNLVLKENKPLALMTNLEKSRVLNKTTHNGQEVNSSIFREQEEKDKAAEQDFKSGSIGKNLTELEIEEEERQKDFLKSLGIEDE